MSTDGDDGRRPAAAAADGDGADPRFLRGQDAQPGRQGDSRPTSTCLMMAQPDRLTPEAALRRRPVRARRRQGRWSLSIPWRRSGTHGPRWAWDPARRAPEFVKLLKAWGVDFDATKTAGDIASAPARAVRRRRPAGCHRIRRLADARPLAASMKTTSCPAASNASTCRRRASSARSKAPRRRSHRLLLTSDKAMQIPADKFGRHARSRRSAARPTSPKASR